MPNDFKTLSIVSSFGLPVLVDILSHLKEGEDVKRYIKASKKEK
jgi:hypothetical protein